MLVNEDSRIVNKILRFLIVYSVSEISIMVMVVNSGVSSSSINWRTFGLLPLWTFRVRIFIVRFTKTREPFHHFDKQVTEQAIYMNRQAENYTPRKLPLIYQHDKQAKSPAETLQQSLRIFSLSPLKTTLDFDAGLVSHPWLCAAPYVDM